MYNPRATYRIQFHKNFSFNTFKKVLPYLQQLGVSTIYASPVFTSVPGSMHGYDGINANQVNPEIGTHEQLTKITTDLRHLNVGWLQDFVPNHMAFHPANQWLMDVLEKGESSLYASFFDVPSTGKIFSGKIMVPFLGAPLQEVIDKGELKLAYKQSKLVFDYFDNHYPVNRSTYGYLLHSLTSQNKAIVTLYRQLEHLANVNDPILYAPEWSEWLLQFSSLMRNEGVASLINAQLQQVNADPEAILHLAGQQHYQLSFWQRTDTRINFRRFFTVNGLIGLNVHTPIVFEQYHAFLKQLVNEGTIQGIRLDHIDGLYDPSTYLDQLRQLTGDDTYIVVEKILEQGEELPDSWPLQGTSGYDYLGIVNNVFTNIEAQQTFSSFYNNLVNDNTSLHLQIKQKKALILIESMGGELDNLTRLFTTLELATLQQLEALSTDELSLAIGEFLINCPVYRYYGNKMPLAPVEAAHVRDIFDEIKQNKPALTNAVGLLEATFLYAPLQQNEAYNQAALRFYQRCMQFTGPLMAKGVEDTLMYTYNRFIAHNEVGDSPEAFGILINDYHEEMTSRKRNWPLTMNTTSTHDTKRGEDVRPRLQVLTDLDNEWFTHVTQWMQMNDGLKVNGAPDANDEYFIYQTLLGVYAMPGQFEDDIVIRLPQYLEKALREAKTNSSWATPNKEYEKATKEFALLLLDKQQPFWKSFSSFHHKVAGFGVVNSLVQLLLKFTAPGVPDVYQGTELWDLSMVDPDNRRPVNYDLRWLWLSEVTAEHAISPQSCWANLWANCFDGKIKLWLTHTLFTVRKHYGHVFANGQYLPIEVLGGHRQYVMAFARRHQQQTILVVVPLHLAALCKAQQCTIDKIDWKDTRLILPAGSKGKTINLLTGQSIALQGEVLVHDLLAEVPFSITLLQQVKTTKRASGILMHITSLPSPFGIGDMGPEAYKFADFLARANQSYWQILPLTPTQAGQSHSPYSSTCSRAGNTLLISPWQLIKHGLLAENEVLRYWKKATDTIDFEYADEVKNVLFTRAWQAWQQGHAPHLQQGFKAFCLREKEWLHDFALYMVLKQLNQNEPWSKWPPQYKLRQQPALQQLAADHAAEIEKTKWLQFIFMHQWKELRSYCNRHNVQLFGDLPFYASYDSVDVWANPEIFSIDNNGEMLQVAGVPPDRFSAGGQLWGMPVFKWDVLKETNYHWWIERLRKNVELFDMVRLDHFRAFSDYWQVPANETTAINGKWIQGPRNDFFRTVKKKLGNLPFVAEDLGDIDEEVHLLRNQFNMPGMKVLQFAFGEKMATGNYIPHNYTNDFIVYTGTHDNNTTKGWFIKDATPIEIDHVSKYAGRHVTTQTVADVLNRLAMASVADIAILPLQDLLELDHTARMNTPGTVQKNWLWRLRQGQLTSHAENHLRFLTGIYNR